MVHRPEEIAAFSSGEKALVYAAQVGDPDGPLIFLPDGDADAMRSYARDHLQCFVPGCPTPSFTTVSRRDQRDGFRHLTGGNHEPESLFHRQAKQALVDWLNSTLPSSRARVEVPLPGRKRVADVLAETESGSFAFEVQYASLTSEGTSASWQARTDDYSAAGLQAVWLFGHHGAQLTVLSDASVWLNAVQTRVIASGRRLWWINPTTSQVATAYVEVEVDGRRFQIPPRVEDRSVHLAISPLADARLDGQGLRTSASVHLDQQAARFKKVLDAHLVRNAALERAREAERRAAAAQAAQEVRREAERAESAARRREAWARSRAERTEREATKWFSSPTYQSVLAAFDGSIPPYLDHPSPSGAVYAHHQHWQAIIYAVLIRDRVGSVIRPKDCLGVLDRWGIRYSPKALDVVTLWLRRLEDECHLSRPLGGHRWEVTVPDIERAARAAAETARQQRVAEERRARRQRARAEKDRLQREHQERKERFAATSPAHASATRPTVCRACGTPLDPLYSAVGIHFLCGSRPHSFR